MTQNQWLKILQNVVIIVLNICQFKNWYINSFIVKNIIAFASMFSLNSSIKNRDLKFMIFCLTFVNVFSYINISFSLLMFINFLLSKTSNFAKNNFRNSLKFFADLVLWKRTVVFRVDIMLLFRSYKSFIKFSSSFIAKSWCFVNNVEKLIEKKKKTFDLKKSFCMIASWRTEIKNWIN